MSLTEQLATTREGSAKRLPPEVQAIMHAATESLRGSGMLDRVIKPGVVAPDFAIEDQSGDTVALGDLRARGPVVISIFRGFW